MCPLLFCLPCCFVSFVLLASLPWKGSPLVKVLMTFFLLRSTLLALLPVQPKVAIVISAQKIYNFQLCLLYKQNNLLQSLQPLGFACPWSPKVIKGGAQQMHKIAQILRESKEAQKMHTLDLWSPFYKARGILINQRCCFLHLMCPMPFQDKGVSTKKRCKK